MNYCPRCGVILKPNSANCPLCGAKASPRKPAASDAHGVDYPADEPRRPEVARGDVSASVSLNAPEPFASALNSSAPHMETAADSGPLDELVNELSGPERRRVAAELLSVAFGVALIVSLLADLFANHQITWSRYTSVVIAAAWLFSAMPLILYGKMWLLYAVLAPSLLLIIFLLDALDGRITWFLGYGMPIVSAFIGLIAAAGGIIGGLRRKGLNALGVFLGGVALLCVCIEGIIDLNAIGSLNLDWSVVVSFALVPTAGLLFYLHYRIVNRASLRKLFRL